MSAFRVIGRAGRRNKAVEKRRKLKILAYYTRKSEEKWWKHVI
jgi:hypothetical protein